MNFAIAQWNHGYKKITIEMYSTHNVGKSMKKVSEFSAKKCVYRETRSYNLSI